MIGPFINEYSFLSNFYLIEIEYNNHIFKSSEHAYQAAKATNEQDLIFIKNSNNPGIAKKRGRTIKIREDWNDVKIQIMKDICRIKFNNPELKQKLIDTGNQKLVELNNWNDVFWGVNINNGKGKNNLGKVLMEIRNELNPKSNKLGQILFKIFK